MNAKSTWTLRAFLTVLAFAVLQTACGGDNPSAPAPEDGETALRDLNPEAILRDELSRRGLSTSWYRGCIWTTFRQRLPNYRGRSFAFILRDIREIIEFCIDAEPPGEEQSHGQLEVITATSGEDLDPSQYDLVVDGGEAAGIGLNDTQTTTEVPAGDHQVELKDIADNCTVEGANPRTVNVSGGATTTTMFTITCTAKTQEPPEPQNGAIRAITSTSGEGVDPDGYSLSIGGGAGNAMAVDDTLTTTGLTPGSYPVQLIGVAANCTVEGDNPRTVTVASGETSDALFEVTCSEGQAEGQGDLRVITTSTTLNKDDDGFTLSLDDGVGGTMAANDTLTLAGLASGEHELELLNVMEGCHVAFPNPRVVTVLADATVEAVFEIGCGSNSLHIVTVTTGADIDPDGYAVSVNGTQHAIGVDDSLTVIDVFTGPNNVLLQFVAANCDVAGDNPRVVQGIRGEKVTTTFTVTCSDVDSGDRSGDIVFDGARTGLGSRGIWIMEADGTDQEQISDEAGDGDPDVSPDGTRIAFHASGGGPGLDIFVMDIDGANRTQLTFSAMMGLTGPQAPAWSPDGSKIAFMAIPTGGLAEIFVMDADGSDVVQLTSSGGGQGSFVPAWSPDGSKIVFSSDRDGQMDIWVMNADGSNEMKLTNDAALDLQPKYSPDGTRIAFASDRDDEEADVYVMNADGSNIVRLTNDPASDYWPAWSSDGLFIAFVSDRSGADTIWVMNADGSNETDVSVQGSDHAPSWVP